MGGMKKLALVGTGPATRELAPFNDLSFDILTFNEASQSPWCTRWDMLLQLHPPEIYTGWNTKNPLHWQWLQQEHRAADGTLKPIYMQAVDPRVPNSVAYPLEQAQALIGYKYLTASVCYALALAKMQGYEQIDVYGVEMSRTEYEYQASCWRFWVGYMKGAGVVVNLHSSAQLFEGLLYGYEGNFAFGSDYFKERAGLIEKEWNLKASHVKSLRRDVERAIKQGKTKQTQASIRQYHEMMHEAGQLAGALSEAERYAAFGERFTDRGGFEYAAAMGQREGEQMRVQYLLHLGMIEYVWNAWAQSGDPRAAEQLDGMVNTLGVLAEKTGALLGKYHENIDYCQLYDDHAKALGMVREVN
jgi:hypothetical protein